jgi:hypothetical protein
MYVYCTRVNEKITKKAEYSPPQLLKGGKKSWLKRVRVKERGRKKEREKERLPKQ